MMRLRKVLGCATLTAGALAVGFEAAIRGVEHRRRIAELENESRLLKAELAVALRVTSLLSSRSPDSQGGVVLHRLGAAELHVVTLDPTGILVRDPMNGNAIFGYQDATLVAAWAKEGRAHPQRHPANPVWHYQRENHDGENHELTLTWPDNKSPNYFIVLQVEHGSCRIQHGPTNGPILRYPWESHPINDSLLATTKALMRAAESVGVPV